jgi:alpha-glucosidase (family GH31 glycosyl hydrolase)
MATGGVGDLRFMLGAGPDAVTKAYHTIVGTPVVTPQWALGWNQCRWGYRNTSDLEAVVAKYAANKLPLDTMWSDIDYMQDYKVFTIDQDNFSDLGAFVANLTKQNMHWIPIIDPGVAQRLPSIEEYLPYTDGLAADIFIHANADNKAPITGSVWADDAVFPDWSHPATPAYWQKWLGNLRTMAAFDGLWLDMNEVSNMLCTGTCYDDQKAASPSQWKLPYIPTGRNLEDKGLSLDAMHHSGHTELDTHSLFGTEETQATHDYFTDVLKQRPMIIERSAFAGMGKYGSRWLGDNFSTGAYMGYSVTGIMAHNIAGIPLAGADICGFIGDTNAELCARWYVVGAFYPFSRNHNSWDTIAQEPWNFDTVYERSVTYLDIIRNAMRTKLHLIRYYYTQLSLVQTHGGAFYKPLFFEFPDEAGAYADQELNVMLGSGVKLGVQSTGTGIDTTDYYFPAGLWCEIINRKGVDGCLTQATSGTVATSSLAFEFALHLRAGHIIPMQDGATLAETDGVSTTAALQTYPVDFHVLPDCTADPCVAAGDYINDDGLTLDWKTERNTYNLTYSQPAGTTPATLTLTLVTTGKTSKINENDVLGTVEIYNAAATGLDTGTYSVSATVAGTATPLDDAVYVASSDRLTATAGSAKGIDLTQTTAITLTRKA